MSFAKAVLDAYGGVYPVHPDAEMDHRKCLAAALRKVVDELTFKEMPVEFTESEWHKGYWSAHKAYQLDLLDLVDELMETEGENQ